MSSHISIGKYRNTRFWGVWVGDKLLAVTVYKRGALAIQSYLYEITTKEGA